MDVRHRLAIFASMFAVAACAAPAASGADQSSWPAAQRASATSSTASGDRQAADSENHMCPGRDNPHKSTHVPGTINVIVNVTCTEPVTQITIRGGFYYNGALTYVGPSKSFSGKATASTNAAVPCKSGYYQGYISYSVKFPPGYEPPTGGGSGADNPNVVKITC